MKLHCSKMEELIRHYWAYHRPGEVISVNLACTIANIIDAVVELLGREDVTIDKIAVKDIAMKAGYSRTTFYVHFCDVYNVVSTLEEMLLCHLEMNSEVYYRLFLNELPEDDVRQVYNMLNHYGKRVQILLKGFSFAQRYKEKFISVITQNSHVSGDIEKEYYSRTCASAMIEGYMFWLEHKNKISYDVIVKTCNKIAEATVYNSRAL